MTARTLLAALLLFAPAIHAQPVTTAAEGRIPLLPDGIVIDGRLDDAAWQGALVQEVGYEVQPGDNVPAPVKTVVRRGDTPDALFVELHARDTEPGTHPAHQRG